LDRDGSRLTVRRLRFQCALDGVFDLTLAFESDDLIHYFSVATNEKAFG